MSVNLLDFDAEGLSAWFAQQGEKPFRARQVLRWIHQRGENDFSAMTDIARSLREKLLATATVSPAPTISDKLSARRHAQVPVRRRQPQRGGNRVHSRG
jgi:23S rRNA (adenine2503-C2)-methyltransferase